MATTIIYNDVTIRDVLTEGIEFTNELDSTGVDPLFTRVTVTCTAVLHCLPGASLGVAGGTMLGDSISRVMSQLMVPRQRFQMLIDGVVLFDVRPARPSASAPLSAADANNGPKPRAKIVSVISNTSARIEFSIELAIPNCSGPGAGYLNLRYWIADDIDENWYTTRIYRGRLRVASKAYSPHWFRNVVMPPLLPTFKREAISFHESDNGLELAFEIRDKEVYAVPPWPATTWRGHHMVVSPTVGGMIHESEVRVEVEGPNSVHRSALAALAGRILNDKLHLSRKAAGQTLMQLYFALNAELAENRVEAIARVKHFDSDQKFFNAYVYDAVRDPFPDVNAPFGYSPHLAPAPVPTASLAGVFLSALNTPCRPATMPRGPTSGGAPLGTPQPTGPVVSRYVGQLPPSQDKYSSEQKTAAYTVYRGRSTIHGNTGKIALPRASAPRLGSKAPSVSIIQLHNGYARRVVEVEAERIGQWPKLPRPTDFTDENGIDHTVMDWEYSPAMPELAADGRTNVTRASARIEYVLSRMPAPGESLPVGNLPYRTADSGESPTTRIPYRYLVEPKSIVASVG